MRYFSEKYNWQVIDLTPAKICRFFEEKGQGPLGNQVAALLEECSFARYAPAISDNAQLERLLGKAREAIVEVEKSRLAQA